MEVYKHLNKSIHSIKLLQVTHVRSLHTSGCGQQQEAVAVESEPEPFSVFRAQENDPVSKSDLTSANVIIMPTARGKTRHMCLVATEVSVHVYDFS